MSNATINRPNVLVIMTDDQGAWALGCAGNSEIQTPNLDRLAEQGLFFENFFCVSPVCSPARASMLTGRIPSQHGVHDWIRKGNIQDPKGHYRGKDRPIEYLKGLTGYTDVLADNGYFCGLSGKWHLGASETPQKGFQWWFAYGFGGGEYYDYPMVENGVLTPHTNYVTDTITHGALRFLELAQTKPQPFYLSVHYTAPHSPWDRANHPAAFYDRYNDCPFDSCPEEPTHPRQVSTAPVGVGEKRRENLQGYFASIEAMDAGVGQIFQQLETLGLNQNTLVIFTSDNGMNMGHHGIWGKGNGTFPQNMFDTSVKVPFIIAYPGRMASGVRCEELFSHYDFLPTLLDYLHLDNPIQDPLPGRSFAPLLRGEPSKGRDEVIIYDEYGPVRMIRTKTQKYIHRYPYGPHEFYDLVKDPHEKNNLIEDPNYQNLIQHLKAQLERWFRRYVDPNLDGTRESVWGRGQIAEAGLRAKGQKNYEDDFSFYAEAGDEFTS